MRLNAQIDIRVSILQAQETLFTSLRDRMTSFISGMADFHIHEQLGYPVEAFPRNQLLTHYDIIRVARDDCNRYLVATSSALANLEAEKAANVLVCT